VIVLAGCRVDTCDRFDIRDPHVFKLKFEFPGQDTREYELAAKDGKWDELWHSLHF
jgi:hypothetical protein